MHGTVVIETWLDGIHETEADDKSKDHFHEYKYGFLDDITGVWCICKVNSSSFTWILASSLSAKNITIYLILQDIAAIGNMQTQKALSISCDGKGCEKIFVAL